MNRYDKAGPTSFALGTQATFYLLESAANQTRKVYITPKQNRDETYERLVSLCKKKGVPVIENNERIFRDLSGKDNVMVIGEFEKTERALDPEGNHVLLVNPSNAGNLGTILRSLVGFGLSDIALITPCVDPFDPKVVRASMGALFHLRLRRYPSFDAYAADAGKRSYYPFMLQAQDFLPEAKRESPYTLIFGNEATGLPESFLGIGHPLKIPQTSLIDSLNLDNAVAIALYEFQKETMR